MTELEIGLVAIAVVFTVIAVVLGLLTHKKRSHH